MPEAPPRPARAVPHVGSYLRELPVSLERMYENALDWEHLPWLHRSSFRSIEGLEAGDWGWRARAELAGGGEEPGPRVLIELALDRERRRWITSTLDGPGAGSEIWTHAFAVGPRRTDVLVDFFVPGVAPEHAAAVGRAYEELYARLYDEDVWMMTVRQQELDANRARSREATPRRLDLGDEKELRASLPRVVELGGRRYRVVELDGELRVHSAVCPHRLGPLDDAPVEDGRVICPWHGYAFDLRSGRATRGERCRLAPPPELQVQASGSVELHLRD